MFEPSNEELIARHSEKWSQYDPDVIPMWVAESDFGTCPSIKESLAAAVAHESFGYSPEPTALREAVSDFYAARYGWRPAPESIFPCTDVVRGVKQAVDYFTRAASPIIIPSPSYYPFFHLAASCGRTPIYIGADEDTGLSLEQIEEGFKKGAGSLILCNPYNPLGFTFDREFMIALADLADRYGARIITDEIHAPLVLEGSHIPMASVSETAAKVTITITAASKAWNIAGLKCAQIIFSNPDDIRIWTTLPIPSRGGVSILGQIGSEAAYRAPLSFLDDQIAYLRRNRDYLIEQLPKILPGAVTTRNSATYLLWVDLRNTVLADSPAERLLSEAKVAVEPGEKYCQACDHKGHGFIRINFACSFDNLKEALRRIEALVSSLS